MLVVVVVVVQAKAKITKRLYNVLTRQTLWLKFVVVVALGILSPEVELLLGTNNYEFAHKQSKLCTCQTITNFNISNIKFYSSCCGCAFLSHCFLRLL